MNSTSQRKKYPPRFLHIKSNGKIQFIEPEKNDDKQLKQLKTLVGGFIQLMPIKAKYRDWGWALYCNEEGALKGLPMNTAINPLCDDDVLIYCARVGGPCGDMVLERPRKNSHVKELRQMFKDGWPAEWGLGMGSQ